MNLNFEQIVIESERLKVLLSVYKDLKNLSDDIKNCLEKVEIENINMRGEK